MDQQLSCAAVIESHIIPLSLSTSLLLRYDKISNKKMHVSIDVLCKNVPPQFCVYLTYTRNLRFVQKPDYKYLRGLFYDLFRQQGFKDDCNTSTPHRRTPLIALSHLQAAR